MGKKFVGLGGLKHFWTKAKTWIAGQITAEVTAKIAEIVANAPEDLDTLKEIADWISTHANDAGAMNTQINTNKNDIAALQISVAGKADAGHKHSASDITSGTLPVANGGTGVTTQADINKAFINNLEVGNSDVTDGTEFVSSYASDNGFAETAEGALNKPYKRQFIKVWNYIKGKISSVLGLTASSYGGKASTAGTADKVQDGNNVVQYKATSLNGYKIQDTQEKALYVEGRELAGGDSGGIAITNDGVTAFGAGDTDGVFRVINEDNVSAGPVFKVMKDGQVYTTNVIHGSIDGSAATAGTADKTVNDITIDIPTSYSNYEYTDKYVILLGKIPEPTSTSSSSYSWDACGSISVLNPSSIHNIAHIRFSVGHGYSHSNKTYVDFDSANYSTLSSIKCFKYNSVWWLGIQIELPAGQYVGNAHITYKRNVPEEFLTAILYCSSSDFAQSVSNTEINSSIQDAKPWWFVTRTWQNPIQAPKFTGDLIGNATTAATATKAKQDADGNTITSTYATKTELEGKSDTGHTHTKSQITDFPTSLPANGGTADKADNGFNSSTVTNSTPVWGYLTSDNGYSNGRTYSFANGGGIATAEKDTKSSLQVDGDLYVHEGLDKVATLNDIPTSLPANGGTADSAAKATTATTATTAYKIRIGNSSPQDGDIWIQ